MKRSKIEVLLLSVLLIITNIKAQDGTRIILGGLPIQQTCFHVYLNDFIVKAEYKDTVDAKNICPEGLIKSIFSCNNQSWENYNTWGGAKNAEKRSSSSYEKVKNMDKNRNYLKLIYRLDFVEDSIPFSIVKFYLHSVGSQKIKSGAFIMKKVNGRWYKTNFVNINFAMMIMRIKTDILSEILHNNILDIQLNKFFDSVYLKNKNVDLLQLANRFNDLYKVENIEILKKVVDENAW